MKMGVEGMIRMVETFGYDQRSGIDLQMKRYSNAQILDALYS
jgi:hypothetical protein